jgi:hypothetical protein
MKKLDNVIKKGGYVYELVQCDKGKAIYRQMLGGLVIAFEVFLIKTQKERTSKFKKPDGTYKEIIFEEREKYPSNENFGSSAWSFVDAKDAKDCYNGLSK